MEILTLDRYRQAIGAKRPETAENIVGLIDAANAHISNYLNYGELDNEVIQVFENRNTYYLNQVNAKSVTSIINVRTGEPIDDSTYFLDELGTVVFFTTPPAGYYRIKLDITDLAIGEDLIQAAILLVEYWDKKDYRDSRSFGGETVAFTSQTTGMPKHIRTILELHRNI